MKIAACRDWSWCDIDVEATGAKLDRMLVARGLRDRELGEMLHLSVQSINKWRHGRSLPDIANLYNLSRIMGVHLEDILVTTIDLQLAQSREAEADSASFFLPFFRFLKVQL